MKRSLEGGLGHWEDFEQLYQQMSDWMSDVESRLGASSDFKADLPEKRSSLERYKVGQLFLYFQEMLNLSLSYEIARSATIQIRSSKFVVFFKNEHATQI